MKTQKRFFLLLLTFLAVNGSCPADGHDDAGQNSDWLLKNSEYELHVSRESGLITKLVSLKPIPHTVLTGNNITIRLRPDWSGSLTRIKSGEMVKGSKNPTLRCRLGSPEYYTNQKIDAQITYSLTDQGVEVDLKIKYGMDVPYWSQIIIGYNAPGADSIRAYASSYNSSLIFAPNASDMLRFQDSLLDTTDFDNTISYPWIVEEKNDRYLFWGSRDVGKFLVLARNYKGFPYAFLQNPSRIEQGKEFHFGYIFKTFPKPEQGPFEIEDWYIKNCYSTNPTTKDLFPAPQVIKPRTIRPGNITGNNSTSDVSLVKDYSKTVAATFQYNLWYTALFSWKDLYPLEGELVTAGGRHKIKDIKATLDEYENNGFHAFAYFRQLYWSNAATSDKEPPYTKWLMKGKDDYYIPLGYFSKGLKFAEPFWPNVKKEIDVEIDPNAIIGFAHVDFCSPKFRRWYIDQVKDVVEFYKPDGIGWDMSWGCDIFRGICIKHPEDGGIHHGELRVQADIYNWIREKYPNMRVMCNSGACNPSAMFSDSVMFEGLGKNTPWDKFALSVQRAKAYRVSMFGLCYDNHYPSLMKALAYGVGWGGGAGLPLTENFADFSAMIMAVPLVVERGAFTLSSAGIIGSMWADKKHLLIACYADTDTELDLNFSKTVTQAYGLKKIPELQVRTVGPDGKKCETNIKQLSPTRFSGKIKAGSLLLIYNQLLSED